MNEHRRYWRQTYERFLDQDRQKKSDRLRVVCYQRWPLLFNRVMDFFERRTARSIVGKSLFAPKDKTVLDIGCGTGRWSEFFKSYQCRVIGTDLFQGLLSYNRKHIPGVTFCSMGATQLALQDSSVDLISAGIVLQHIPRNEKALVVCEMARVLRPGGGAFILESVAQSGYKEGKTASLLRVDEWRELFTRCGFDIVVQKSLHAYPLALFYGEVKAWLGKMIKRLKSLGNNSEIPVEAMRSLQSSKEPLQKRIKYALYHFLDQTILWVVACVSFPLEFLCLALGWGGTHSMFLVQKGLGASVASASSRELITSKWSSSGNG